MYELLKTADGSITYRNTALGVTYRSIHGAESESRYVFFEGTGLSRRDSPWRVLELGFGTGLNFAVTCREAQAAGVELEYVSLEPEPIPRDLWLVEPSWRALEFGTPLVQGSVRLKVEPQKWQETSLAPDTFHACYHDPFGPSAAPECWETACFEWSARALVNDAVLATFGASTSARAAMKQAGYYVGTLKGAHGKREMTVASKSEAAIDKARPWKRDR